LVCTPSSDVEGCANFVMGYWESIARGLFGDEHTVPKICGYLEYCKKSPQTPRIACNDCIRGLNEIGTLFQTNEELSAETLADLQGHVYCENEDETILKPENCKDVILLFSDPALKALGTLLHASAQRICTDTGCTNGL
jgi:hypothetical protein